MQRSVIEGVLTKLFTCLSLASLFVTNDIKVLWFVDDYAMVLVKVC